MICPYSFKVKKAPLQGLELFGICRVERFLGLRDEGLSRLGYFGLETLKGVM